MLGQTPDVTAVAILYLRCGLNMLGAWRRAVAFWTGAPRIELVGDAAAVAPG
jgi:hypothetical protein